MFKQYKIALTIEFTIDAKSYADAEETADIIIYNDELPKNVDYIAIDYIEEV